MDVERRSLLKGLAAGLAGSVVTPERAAADPHASPTANIEQASSGVQPPAIPGLLDEHQRRTLEGIADLILPGSVAAGAVSLIDRVTAVDGPEAQRLLLNAVARFDQEARLASGARWLDLANDARTELLMRASTEAPGRPAAEAWTKGQPVVVPAARPPARRTLRDDFDFLKVTIGNAYAATEAGMQALGWAGRSAWRELPGCTHANPEHE